MAIYSHLHLKVYLIDCGRVEAIAIPYVCGLTHFCAFGRAGRRTRRCRREESEVPGFRTVVAAVGLKLGRAGFKSFYDDRTLSDIAGFKSPAC